MKVCLVGDFTGTPDEGMKNISKTLSAYISKNNDTIFLGLRDLLKSQKISEIREFSPDVIHYFHGPTIKSLVILRLVKLRLGDKVKIVVSATRPYFSLYTRWLIPLLKPDLVLSQSGVFEQFFESKGCKTKFIANGVDCEKFTEVSMQDKQKIRQVLHLPLDERIVLHVGHIKTNRRLEIFKEVQQIEGIQVVIVGGTDQVSELSLKKDLESKGIIVIHKFLDDISIVYKAADLYVFPIEDSGNKMPSSYNQVGAIDLPLSILEAMACNLPIITTKFGALQRIFNSGKGFIYIDSVEEIISYILATYKSSNVSTRDMVERYDWPKIAKSIEAAYEGLVT